MYLEVSKLGVAEEYLEGIISKKTKEIELSKEENKYYLNITRNSENLKLEISNDKVVDLFKKTRRDRFKGYLKDETLEVYTYIPLHITTSYTLNQSLIMNEDVIGTGFPVAAITDDNLFGFWKFNGEMKKRGKKAICGCKIKTRIKSKNESFYLILLAKNITGYKNIVKLLSMNLSYYSEEHLKRHSEGIICLDGGIEGELYSLFCKRSSNTNGYLNIIENIFGENFYAEVSDSMSCDLREIIEFYVNSNVKVVATDAPIMFRYNELNKRSLEVVGMLSSKKLPVINKKRFFHSLDEMEEIYGETSFLLANSLNIADECESINIEENAIEPDEELYEIIKDIVYSEAASEEYTERLDKEFDIIDSMNYKIYINLMFELNDFCTEAGILYKVRGSANSLLIFYLLGITSDNPLENGLLLERFISKIRHKKIDIDIDIQKDKVEEVEKFLINKGGFEIRKISKVIHYKDDTLEKNITTLVNSEKIDYMNSEEIRVVVDVINSMPKSYGAHGSGVALINGGFYPEYTPKSNDSTKVITVDKDGADYLSFLKLDLLSNNYLRVINETAREVNVKLNEIGFDRKAYGLLAKGKTTGIFQLSNPSYKEFLKIIFKDYKTLEEDELMRRLMHAIAIIRPNSAPEQNFYVENLNMSMDVPKPYDILAETKGILLFQEQIVLLLNALTNAELSVCEEKRKDLCSGDSRRENSAKKWLQKNSIDINLTAEIYENFIERYKSYTYNKAHALSFAKIVYLTLYFRSNYRGVYLKNLLNYSDEKDRDDLIKRLEEIVLPPRADESELDFTVKDNCVLMGFNCLQGIKFEKKPVYYPDLNQFITENDIDLEDYETLALSGALDVYGYRQDELLQMKSKIDYLESMQYKFSDIRPEYENIFKLGEEEDVNYEQRRKIILRQESISEEAIEGFSRIDELLKKPELYRDSKVECIGRVTNIKRMTTKKDDNMLSFMLAYKGDKIKVTVFPKKMNLVDDIKLEDIVIVKGEFSVSDYGPAILVNEIEYTKNFRCGIRKIFVKKQNQELLRLLRTFESKDKNKNSIEVIYNKGEEEFNIRYSYYLESSLKRFDEIIKIV